MLLTKKQIEWAYEKWCIGYTKEQIAEALYCSYGTIYKALKGRKRIRPILTYDGERE